MFSNAGKQMEHLTLETMKQQQETLQKMEEAVRTMEQEMKQYSAQLNAQYTGYVKQLGGNPFTPQIEEWQGKWNEFAQQMQQFSISPAKSFCIFPFTSKWTVGRHSETISCAKIKISVRKSKKQMNGFS
ncbi:hypothetical protein GCM10020331_072700 [Ectobacillus funiculus]